jgi:8-oxo-dGTP pyrophosphatase MutT (NUDIX family)
MQSLTDSLKYRQWAEKLKANGVSIRSLKERDTIRKKDGEVLFSMIEMDAVTEQGQKLLPIALLRGHFVSIVTVLIDKSTREEFYLMVGQRRVADGALHWEHPAGMTDSDTDPFATALKEMEEETGLKVTREQVHLLREGVVYSSPGLLDEGGYFFCCEIEMDRSEIESFRARLLGDAHEGEFIQTRLMSEAEVWPVLRNAHGLLNMFLYREFKGGR